MLARALALAAALALGSASHGAAQNQCNLLENQKVDRVLEGGVPMVHIQGPFLVVCTGGAELRANQGTLNELSRELLLVGNVSYRDLTRTLTADQATYSSAVGRLYATGNVVFVDETEGMTIRGPELEYFRALPERPQAQVNASQRPHLTLRPESNPEGEPLEIDADRMTILGKDDLSAFGNVVIQRPDLRALAQEARYTGATQGLELRGEAEVQNRENLLRGEVIQARLRDNVLEEVRARTNARLVSDELNVSAPELQLFFADSLLQRTVARTAGEKGARAVAVSRTFRLEADSLDALAPGQVLQQVIAIGTARGETIDTTAAPRDSAAPAPADTSAAAAGALAASDWIRGDTIIGYFAPADSAALARGQGADSSVVLEKLVARGAAQSLYRMEQRSDTAGAPRQPPGERRKGINFASGDVITLLFQDGEVQEATFLGLRRGLYLDPVIAPPQQEQNPPQGPVARAGG